MCHIQWSYSFSLRISKKQRSLSLMCGVCVCVLHTCECVGICTVTLVEARAECSVSSTIGFSCFEKLSITEPEVCHLDDICWSMNSQNLPASAPQSWGYSQEEPYPGFTRILGIWTQVFMRVQHEPPLQPLRRACGNSAFWTTVSVSFTLVHCGVGVGEGSPFLPCKDSAALWGNWEFEE